MGTVNRRTFLVRAGVGTAAAGVMAGGTAAEAQKKILLGAIGCGGRGTYLAQTFAGMPDVEVVFVCDADRSRAERAAGAVERAGGKKPKVVTDLRRILDDPSVDAITIATPDHWHAPATILACEAGKHVYVEKPASHNIREGRLMVEAARRHKRVVQVGTQSRSLGHVRRAIELLRDGAIGEVLVAKAWNSQRRANIGHATPSDPPPGLDYDMWLGPAPYVPFQKNRFHYTWHWWYAFGTGDMGNDGVHDLDIARWGLGVETHPSVVAALGGKYFFDDDQQFPDTQYVIFEYPGNGRVGDRRQLIYEQRIWSPYRQEEYENGNAFYGTKGYLLLSKSRGWKLFGERNKLKEQMTGSLRGTDHQRDFIDAIRSGSRPNADIAIGHLSSCLSHLGNIATRLARTLRFDPKAERFLDDDEANRLVRREYREGHWAVPKGV
ncbi:MAG: Gfo/Idh/MocA family oxidoreductase [Planctomycetes bacterium]|nr:Gfo/Idh/MocA family oxidoreductase [Planctomycetota bacterium]